MQTIEARFSRIESQLSKMKNEFDAVLKIQVSLIMRLNAQSKAELTAAAEIGVGDAELTISPSTPSPPTSKPTTPAVPPERKPTASAGLRRTCGLSNASKRRASAVRGAPRTEVPLGNLR